jgi:membrane-associated phospholipid phosphatase
MPTFKSHTPPGTNGKRVAGDASATAQALIAADQALSLTQPGIGAIPPVRFGGTAAADGLERFADEARLLKLDASVRYTLCIAELLSLVRVKPTVGNQAAEIVVTPTGGTGVVVAKITRPTKNELVGTSTTDPARQILGVATAAAGRSNLAAEIVAQDADLEMYFMNVLRLDHDTFVRTDELISVVAGFIYALVQELKYHFMVPRPTEVAPKLTTVAPVPGHSSYPSGHAMQAMAIAKVLVGLRGRVPGNLCDLATGPVAAPGTAGIGHNRVVAGLHYPSDSVAGIALGELLADVLNVLRVGTGSVTSQQIQGVTVTSGAPTNVAALAPRFKTLWDAAETELNA